MAGESDRRQAAYREATALTQAMLDECFRGGENQIETVGVLTKTVGASTYTLRFSDRAKYVGDDYYHGRAKFPTMLRTIGELVAPSIQFSEMEIELSNVDGFYNQYLENGANYFSFIGARLEIRVGLRDNAATYFTIFDGNVPDEDGFSVERERIVVRARDKFDSLNKKSGLPTINTTDFPSAPQPSLGKIIPMALGDWTAGYNVTANAGTDSVTNGGVNYQVVTDAPNNFYGGLIGYHVGGGYFCFSIGTYTPGTIAAAHIKRGEKLLQVNFNATPQNTAGYWSCLVYTFNVYGGGTIPYTYQDGDLLLISVIVPYAVGSYSNIIKQAKEILFTLGDKVPGDLDSTSWTAYETKSTPAVSATGVIPARTWVGKEDDTVLGYALQLLEQVRVELFIDRNQKIALRALHTDEFTAPGSAFRLEQIYMDEESLQVKADERNFFNRALANFAWIPATDKTELQTGVRKNQNSIDKSGKEITKAIDMPNLYVLADVQNQLDEFIRLYSASLSYIGVRAGWPTMLRDLGETVSLNYRIGSIDLDNKPALVRDILFDPANASFTFRFLSLANFAYTGYAPSNSARFLSSATQAITDA